MPRKTLTKDDVEEIVSEYNKATDQTINAGRHQLYEMLQSLTDLVLDLQLEIRNLLFCKQETNCSTKERKKIPHRSNSCNQR